MQTEAIFLGILLGFIYYELIGLTPGGIIAPGYIALAFDRYLILTTTLVAVLLTYLIVRLLSQMIILYGRRAFMTAVLVGFFLKWGLEAVLGEMNLLPTELVIIGYIIPGLIANEMRKQGILETLFSCAIVAGLVVIILQIQKNMSL